MTRTAQRDEVRKLLRDRRLHKLYAYDAIRRAGRLRTATPHSIVDLATRFNAFAPVRNEPVTLRWVDKGSGRRWVHDFGPRRRMQQALVAAILRHLHPPRRTQKLFNGGMPAAREAVEAAVGDGLTHGVEIDFVDFYGRVRHDRLADLLRPLPASVVDNVVWDIAMRDGTEIVVVGEHTTVPTSSVPVGLSLGAATSPIVGERIIAEVLAVAQLSSVVTYADNLFVLGRSTAEVDACVQTIQESALRLEIGPLELRDGYSEGGHDLTRPFVFLKREGLVSEGAVVWRPSQSKLNQFRVGEAERPLSSREIDAVANRIRYWRRSYPDWPEGDVEEAALLAALAVRLYYADANPANRTAAVHAVTIAHIAAGSVREVGDFVPDVVDAIARGKRAELIQEIERWWAGARNRQSAEPLSVD